MCVCKASVHRCDIVMFVFANKKSKFICYCVVCLLDVIVLVVLCNVCNRCVIVLLAF